MIKSIIHSMLAANGIAGVREDEKSLPDIRDMYAEEVQEWGDFIKSESEDSYLESTFVRTRVQDGDTYNKKSGSGKR